MSKSKRPRGSGWGGPRAPETRIVVAQNVPGHEVEALIAAFKAEGARNLRKIQNLDGTFDIEAEFED